MNRKNLIALLVGLLISAALLELLAYGVLALRGYSLGDESERHLYSAYRGHELNPDYARETGPDGGLLHSPDGFRRSEPVEVGKPEGVFRILAMGGSGLYGAGATGGMGYPPEGPLGNGQTVTACLEEMLNEKCGEEGLRVRVEVVNAGVMAYHTFQHLVYYMERLYLYESDMVLFFDGHNDFYVSKPGYNPMLDYGYSSILLTRSVNGRSLLFSLYCTAGSLGRYSHFFKLAEEVLENMWEAEEAVPSDHSMDHEGGKLAAWEENARNGFLRIYDLFKTLGARDGFAMHVFLQPEVVLEDLELLSEHDRRIRDITVGHVRDTESIMKDIRARLPEKFAELGVGYTDVGSLAGPDTRTQDLYFDYCHLTPEGSRVAASRMAPVVMDVIRARTAVSSSP